MSECVWFCVQRKNELEELEEKRELRRKRALQKVGESRFSPNQSFFGFFMDLCSYSNNYSGSRRNIRLELRNIFRRVFLCVCVFSCSQRPTVEGAQRGQDFFIAFRAITWKWRSSGYDRRADKPWTRTHCVADKVHLHPPELLWPYKAWCFHFWKY